MGADSVSQWFAQSLLIDVDQMTGIHVPPLSAPIIEGLLRRGHLMMLTGPPKAGKSWAMVQLAYAVATGGTWMGFKCQQGTVCYIDTELDPNSLYNRFDRVRAKLGLRDSCGNIKVLSMRGQTITAESLANTIIDAYGDEMPSLIIIDSIYSIESGDENSAGDMREMLQQLGRLLAGGSALAFAHHHAKGNAGTRNVIDRGSGSGVFGRFVDAMVDLTPTVPDESQKEMLNEMYGGNAVPMRMSFVLREFADPGSKDVVFDFPLLKPIDGGIMAGAPEEGTALAGRVLGAKANREKAKKRWTEKDESIGRAVNACLTEGVPPTRQNVAERMVLNGEKVSFETLKRWTVGDASTKWRARQDGGAWLLYCTDEGWTA